MQKSDELFEGVVYKQSIWSRVSLPFTFQSDAMDCGPACMAMISTFFGNGLSINYWRNLIPVDQSGSSLYDLSSAAESSHFITHGFQIGSVADVEPALFPFIANRNYHFVVVYKMEKGRVVVADPAAGIRTLSIEEFDDGLEAVLFLKPTAGFLKVRETKRPYRHLLKLFSGYTIEFLTLFLFSIVLSVVSVIPPYLFQFVFDHALVVGNKSLLQIAIIAMLAVSLLSSLMGGIRNKFIQFLNFRFDFNSGGLFVQKVFSLPYAWVQKKHFGDFSLRLGELLYVRSFFSDELIEDILQVFSLVIYLTILWQINAPIAKLLMIVGPILIIFPLIFSKKLLQLSNEVFVKGAEVESLLVDQIKGFSTLKSLNAELSSRWRFEESFLKKLSLNYQLGSLSGWSGAVSGFVYSATQCLVLFKAAEAAIDGTMSVGQVFTVVMLSQLVLHPFERIAHFWGKVIYLRIVLDRLNDVFLEKSEVVVSGKSLETLERKKIVGKVEFRDVHFRYGGESSDWILKGVSFTINPGQHVAIVGPSGSGKSTIAMLISRILEPNSGSILIDDIDIKDYDLHKLRNEVGILLQEAHLYRGTILENIMLSNPVVDTERLKNAVKISDSETMIADKAQGFSQMLTHGGLGLSVGQKQRIALARVLYRTPALLVLDEATSSLDVSSEKKIVTAIKNELRHMTIISIAHRFNTVQMADLVLVIKDGRIVEFGSHSELKKLNGQYCSLFGGLNAGG